MTYARRMLPAPVVSIIHRPEAGAALYQNEGMLEVATRHSRSFIAASSVCPYHGDHNSGDGGNHWRCSAPFGTIWRRRRYIGVYRSQLWRMSQHPVEHRDVDGGISLQSHAARRSVRRRCFGSGKASRHNGNIVVNLRILIGDLNSRT